MADSDPLRIAFPSTTTVLSSSVENQSHHANEVCLSGPQEDEPYFRVGFDHLEAKEGAIVRFLVTGEDDTVPTVDGRLKGAGKPVEEWLTQPEPWRSWISIMLVCTVLVVLLPVGIGVASFPSLGSVILWVLASVVAFFLAWATKHELAAPHLWRETRLKHPGEK